jgi:hypothetical protein
MIIKPDITLHEITHPYEGQYLMVQCEGMQWAVAEIKDYYIKLYYLPDLQKYWQQTDWEKQELAFIVSPLRSTYVSAIGAMQLNACPPVWPIDVILDAINQRYWLLVDPLAKRIEQRNDVDIHMIGVPFLNYEKGKVKHIMTREEMVDPDYWEKCKEVNTLPPELEALVGCAQDPEHHPEGDAFQHTMLCLRHAQRLGGTFVQRLAVLCHDLGKPATTQAVDGRIRTYDHDTQGVRPTKDLLHRMGLMDGTIDKAVIALVLHHMTPMHLGHARASLKAYRRLARRLMQSMVTLADMEFVVRCDELGRGKDNKTPRANVLHQRSQELAVVLYDEIQQVPAVVMGRHLIAMGMEPGPHFGPILAECRKIQEALDWTDPDAILDIALKSGID